MPFPVEPYEFSEAEKAMSLEELQAELERAIAEVAALSGDETDEYLLQCLRGEIGSIIVATESAELSRLIGKALTFRDRIWEIERAPFVAAKKRRLKELGYEE